MKIFSKNKQSGFSLVELMIVVGIIGVLATLALPRFKQFQAKAKAAEAGNLIQHLYTLEQSYSLDNNDFVTMGAFGAGTGAATGGNSCSGTNSDTLGFSIDPCATNGPIPRFQYEVTGGGATFMAVARTGGGAANRICINNAVFSLGISETNASFYGVGSGTPGTAGALNIGKTCTN